MTDVPESDVKFILSTRKNDVSFELTSPNPTVKNEWIKSVQSQLDSQVDFVKGIYIFYLFG